MTKYLAGVLSLIAAGVLLIAYGLLAPQASATFGGSERFVIVQPARLGDGLPGYAYPYQVVASAASAEPLPVPVNTVQQPISRRAVYDVAPAERMTAPVSPVPRRAVHPSVRAPRRDWKKTALVIGGSSATGAGVGAIFGGKKGALIGAAIGGGASTLWETTKD